MANITITELLGGDNIAGSRITINDNFKKVTNAINTLEGRLDTSFNPGGALNVGNAIIKKYTNPTSAQIFTCEATGLFQGNLNVSLNLGITQSATIAQSLTVNKNITFDGSAVGGGTLTSLVPSIFSNEFRNSQLGTGGYLLNPQAISGSGASRTMAAGSLLGYSVLRLNLSAYSGTAPNDCDTITIPAGTNGQILTVIIATPAAASSGMTDFTITSTNFVPGSAPIVFAATGANFETNGVKKLAITLFYDSLGWRVLSVAQPGSVYTITY